MDVAVEQLQITVIVGQGKKTYKIPRDLLIQRSDFFKAAITKPWKEAQDGYIYLPEIDIGIFEAYHHWLIEDEVIVVDLAECKSINQVDKATAAALRMTLVPLWLAAQLLGDLPLRIAIINKLLRYMVQGELVCFPGPQSVEMAWTDSAEDSTLRRLMFDMLNAYYQPMFVRENWDAYGEELVKDLQKHYEKNLKRTRDVTQGTVKWEYVVSDPATRGKCFYHEHDERFPICGSG